MAVKDILDTLDGEIKCIHKPGFSIEVTETFYAPNDSDTLLTYENFDLERKKVKTIETCVLYIDIRKSTRLNLKHKPETMAKLYSSFIRAMLKAAEAFNGRIRNIVGDRVMVVYDAINCYDEAVNTAALMNTITQGVINKRFSKNLVKCGIGIDYGKMMVTKCGTIKRGNENSDYKSLVWLGKPANIASKLTDSANKPSTYRIKSGFHVGLQYPFAENLSWYFYDNDALVENIAFSYLSPSMHFKHEYFSSFYATKKQESNDDATPPILITERVYNGLKKISHPSIKGKHWKEQKRKISDYSGKTFGADLKYAW